MGKVVWTVAAVALAATVAASTSAEALPTLRTVVVDDDGTPDTPMSGDDDDGDTPDAPLSGGASDRAVRAALAHTGGGQVTETELGDDGAAYGVEIRRADGTEVEVELDASFTVIGEELDEG